MKDIKQLANKLKQLDMKMVTAESCTGGLIAKQCTDLAGSSAWFECGYVTYSNRSKIQMLGVDKGLIEVSGAVSQVVAEAMANGALKNSCAQISVAVTGVAGPDGGTEKKPVGTVWVAWAKNDLLKSQKFLFEGDREQVRVQTASEAVKGLMKALGVCRT